MIEEEEKQDVEEDNNKPSLIYDMTTIYKKHSLK